MQLQATPENIENHAIENALFLMLQETRREDDHLGRKIARIVGS